MKFEWDSEKNAKNKSKHGIDFETAEGLWTDESRIEIHAPHPVENRLITISRLNGKLWTAVYTIRNEKIRIISVRRSREKEAAFYEKQNDGKKHKRVRPQI